MWYGWSATWIDSADPKSLQTIKKTGETYRGALKIKPGTRGTVRLAMMAHFVLELETSTQQFYVPVECTWTVDMSKTGEIKTGAAQPSWFAARSQARIRQQAGPLRRRTSATVRGQRRLGRVHPHTAVPDQAARRRAHRGILDFNLDIRTRKKSGGGGGIGISKTGDTETKTVTAPGATFANKSLAIRLEHEPIKEPEPEIEIGNVQVFAKKTHRVEFFDERNTALKGAQREDLMEWYRLLSRATRHRLRTGKQKMRLEAYAELHRPGPAQRRGLRQAARRVRAAVINRFVANWDEVMWAEDKAPDESPEITLGAEDRRRHERKDPARLVVVLTVMDDKTPGAQVDEDADLMPTE